MDLVVGAVLTGIMTGGVYALMASGLTLIFGVMDIINVAQGALIVLGGYLAFTVQEKLHIDPFVGLVITMPVMFLLGVAIEVSVIRPLKRERTMLSILVTFAIALIIEGVLTLLYTTNLRQINGWYVDQSFPVGSYYIAYIYVLGFGLSVVLLGALYVFLYRTKYGRAIRATVQNRVAAELIGIDVERVSAITFGIGVGLSAAGGAVFGALNTFNPGSAYDLISRLLVIIILGGMGSLSGALIAAILMLVIEDVTSVVWSPTWASAVFYIVLVVVLLFRPQGLFGQLETRRQ